MNRLFVMNAKNNQIRPRWHFSLTKPPGRAIVAGKLQAKESIMKLNTPIIERLAWYPAIKSLERTDSPPVHHVGRFFYLEPPNDPKRRFCPLI